MLAQHHQHFDNCGDVLQEGCLAAAAAVRHVTHSLCCGHSIACMNGWKP